MRHRPLESEVQLEITKALELAGFYVWHTTAFRQKLASGCSKGVPDLLVSHPIAPGSFLGLEVKRPGAVRYSSQEQREAVATCRVVVACSAAQSLTLAHWWLQRMISGYPQLSSTATTHVDALDKSRRLLIALCGKDAKTDGPKRD